MTKFDDELGEHLSLDLLIVTPETRLSWDSRITVEWEGGTLKVVSPKGLIELKSLRKSGQDAWLSLIFVWQINLITNKINMLNNINIKQ